MAYIDSKKIALIRDEVKRKYPTKNGWKFSITGDNYSTVRCAIMQSPIDFQVEKHENLNHYSIEKRFKDNEQAQNVLTDLRNILNGNFLTEKEQNFDKSEPMTDYFDVGWYINLSVGQWDKPYVYKPVEQQEKKVVEVAPQIELPKGKLQIVAYSDKSIAVIGDTYTKRELLRSLGGKFNKFLSVGAGWIFATNKLEDLKLALV